MLEAATPPVHQDTFKPLYIGVLCIFVLMFYLIILVYLLFGFNLFIDVLCRFVLNFVFL